MSFIEACLSFGVALYKRTLHVVEETRSIILELRRDMQNIKMAMNSATNSKSDYSDAIAFLDKPLNNEKELDDLCAKLAAERPFRNQVICVTIL